MGNSGLSKWIKVVYTASWESLYSWVGASKAAYPRAEWMP